MFQNNGAKCLLRSVGLCDVICQAIYIKCVQKLKYDQHGNSSSNSLLSRNPITIVIVLYFIYLGLWHTILIYLTIYLNILQIIIINLHI